MSRLLVFFFSRFVFSCGLLLSHAVRSRFIHVDVRSHIVHMMSLTHTHTGLQTCLGSWAQISRVLTAQKHLVLDLSQISLRMKKSDLKLCDTATPRPWSSLCTNWLECVPLCVCILYVCLKQNLTFSPSHDSPSSSFIVQCSFVTFINLMSAMEGIVSYF